MSKRTPGPWRVAGYRNHNPSNRGIFPISYEIWPEVTVKDQTGIVVKGLGVLSEANARLIAAAPDLLEACKKALGALGKYAPKESLQVQEAVFDLDAAIARAEKED